MDMDRILTASIAKLRAEIPASQKREEESGNSGRDGRRPRSRGLD